jgi:hypothetical protein
MNSVLVTMSSLALSFIQPLCCYGAILPGQVSKLEVCIILFFTTMILMFLHLRTLREIVVLPNYDLGQFTKYLRNDLHRRNVQKIHC